MKKKTIWEPITSLGGQTWRVQTDGESVFIQSQNHGTEHHWKNEGQDTLSDWNEFMDGRDPYDDDPAIALRFMNRFE